MRTSAYNADSSGRDILSDPGVITRSQITQLFCLGRLGLYCRVHSWVSKQHILFLGNYPLGIEKYIFCELCSLKLFVFYNIYYFIRDILIIYYFYTSVLLFYIFIHLHCTMENRSRFFALTSSTPALFTFYVEIGS